MEWIKRLIEKHTKDGKVDTEGLMKEINTEFPKNAVPKDTYNSLSETKKQLEKDISERDKQLEELKKVDAEGLKTKIESLQADNKKAKEEYDSQVKDLTLTNAIKLAIAGKVHDEGLVAGLFDKSKLILGDDGKITGLDEQLTTLKESKAFLFKEEELGGTGGSKGNGNRNPKLGEEDGIGKKLADAQKAINDEMAKSQDLYFK